MSRTLLIDGDSICYICSKDTFEESAKLVDKLMAEIIKTTRATNYIVFLSKGPYYRHIINPEYKANRKASPLLWLKSLKAYLIERYKAHIPSSIEADDAVAYYKSFMPDAVICAIDKDVLKQVAGEHYNYYKREWVVTTPEQAHKWLYLQALMGDPGDNIKGLPKVGIKKAEKILAPHLAIKYKFAVLDAYCTQYGDVMGIKEFYDNFFQVYLLRTKEEIERFIGELPLVSPVEIVNEEKDEW